MLFSYSLTVNITTANTLFLSLYRCIYNIYLRNSYRPSLFPCCILCFPFIFQHCCNICDINQLLWRKGGYPFSPSCLFLCLKNKPACVSVVLWVSFFFILYMYTRMYEYVRKNASIHRSALLLVFCCLCFYYYSGMYILLCYLLFVNTNAAEKLKI